MAKRLPIHIFLITNDKNLSNTLVQNLEIETDYVVFLNSTGEEFFNEIVYNPIPRNAIPIIIVDYDLKSLEMPTAVDGLAVLKDIKSNNPGWQVITLSDYALKKVKNDALQLGAFCHVFKNDNISTRLKFKINELENQEKLKRERRSTYRTIYVFIAVLAFFLLVAFLCYIFE